MTPGTGELRTYDMVTFEDSFSLNEQRVLREKGILAVRAVNFAIYHRLQVSRYEFQSQGLELRLECFFQDHPGDGITRQLVADHCPPGFDPFTQEHLENVTREAEHAAEVQSRKEEGA